MTDKEGNIVIQPYKSACYCTNLRRSANIISDFYDAALKDAGLTVAQYYLLINLSRLGSANITHWAAHVGLERSTMVRNIKLLQVRDFVEVSEGHGKVFTLSSEGKRVLELAVPLWQKAQEQIEDVLGADDTATVLRLSEKLQGLSRRPEV